MFRGPRTPWHHLVICLVILCAVYLVYLMKYEPLFSMSKEYSPVITGEIKIQAEMQSEANQIDTSYITLQPMTPTTSHTPFPSTIEHKRTEISHIGKNQKSAFSKMLEKFQWEEYKSALKANNFTAMKSHLEKLILQLTPWLAMEPLIPINPNCTIPPPLDPPEQVNCSNYPTGLTGTRISPVKIGVLTTFGFDLDVLEIYLHELYDVVDKFFILEAVRSTSVLSKPLLWEKVKRTSRFAKFLDKVVHFVLDDAQIAEASVKMELTPGSPTTMRAIERLQEVELWDKFLEWNAATKFFNNDDVLCIGDSDEIPAREMVNLLKYCQMKDDRLDFGIWFPFGNINYAFRTDHPIPGLPLTFGNPGFWTLRSALALGTGEENVRVVPVRTYGHAPNHLLGGMHMTNNGYLPYQIVKFITASEGRPFGLEEVSLISNRVNVAELEELEFKMAAVPANFWPRIRYLNRTSEKMRKIAIFPWFYNCNRERYPVWEGRHDSRVYLPIES